MASGGAAPAATPSSAGAPVVNGIPGEQTAAQITASETAAGLSEPQMEDVTEGKPSGAPANAPLLTTSSASRATTSSNVNSYNTAVTGMATPSPTTPVTPSVVNPTPTTGSSSSPSNTNPGSSTPSSNPGGSTTSAPSTANPGSGSGASTQPVINGVTFSDGSSGQYNQSTNVMTDGNGNTLTWNGTGWVNPLSPGTPLTATNTGPIIQPPAATSAAGGTTYGQTPAGQNAYSAAIASGMPASIAQSYADNIDNLSQSEVQAKATLAAAAATVQNDPVATAAIAAISAKYDVLLQSMTASNTQALGKASTAVAAFGGLGVMNQTFMSNEMDAASQRLATIVSEQQSAMLTAQNSYAKQDLDAFNTAMTAYQKTLTDMNTALNDLNTATDKQVTQTQDATKISAAAAKQQLASDISNSTKLAAGIVQSLQNAGITDASGISQEDIQGIAEENGISDPSLLYAAVVSAFGTAAKTAASVANTTSEISSRAQTTADTNAKTTYAVNKPYPAAAGSLKGGTDGTFTYTPQNLQTASGILDNGGTIDGTTYNGRGADGYVDPGAYVAIYQSWIASGGTPKGFAAKFPVKTNVNPASYSQLPTVLQPSTASAATPPN